MNAANPATEAARPTVCPTFRYDDAPAALRFLVDVLGFTAGTVTEEPDGSIAHAEVWHGPGLVMLGSRRGEPSPYDNGKTSTYVVVDDPDAVHERAVASGATIVRGLTEQDYGSRECSVEDPEGNVWTVGTYAPAPPV